MSLSCLIQKFYLGFLLLFSGNFKSNLVMSQSSPNLVPSAAATVVICHSPTSGSLEKPIYHGRKKGRCFCFPIWKLPKAARRTRNRNTSTPLHILVEAEKQAALPSEPQKCSGIGGSDAEEELKTQACLWDCTASDLTPTSSSLRKPGSCPSPVPREKCLCFSGNTEMYQFEGYQA